MAFTCLFLSLFLLIGCNSDDDSSSNEGTIEEEVTEEEAVEIIELSLQSNSGGLSEITSSFCRILVLDYILDQECDQPYEESLQFIYDGPRVTSDYAVNWFYQISCTGEAEVQSVEFLANYEGVYTTPYVNSNDLATASFEISSLDEEASFLVLSGEYNREGTQDLNFDENSRDISSSITSDLTDLVVDKSDYRIESGSGSVQLTAVNDNNTFTFEGSISFNGNGNATIIINGNEYEIDCD